MSKKENWQGKHIIKLRDYKQATIIDEPDALKLREEVEPWLTALRSEILCMLQRKCLS